MLPKDGLLRGVGRGLRWLLRRALGPPVPEVLEEPEGSVTGAYTRIRDRGGRDESYGRFEEIFYDRAAVAELQERYLPFVLRAPRDNAGILKVVDVGCGRGDFVRLLSANGIEVIGIEPSVPDAERLREQGFTVLATDAVRGLGSLCDESLSAVVAFQVIEHMQPHELTEFIHLAVRKLVPGGVMIVETPNPRCPQVGWSFWLDVTHVRPYPLETTAFYMLEAGSRDLRKLFVSPVPYLMQRPWRREANYSSYALVGVKALWP